MMIFIGRIFCEFHGKNWIENYFIKASTPEIAKDKVFHHLLEEVDDGNGTIQC